MTVTKTDLPLFIPDQIYPRMAIAIAISWVVSTSTMTITVPSDVGEGIVKFHPKQGLDS